MRGPILILAVSLFLATACASSEQTEIRFEEVAQKSGLALQHRKLTYAE